MADDINQHNDGEDGQRRQNPKGNRQNERQDAPELPEVHPDEKTNHWIIQLVDRAVGGVKKGVRWVKDKVLSLYDSKHYPLIVYILFIVSNGFLDIMGWYNLFQTPKWSIFSCLVGGGLLVLIYYVSYYHKIFYKLNSQGLDVVLINDRVTHEIQFLFTGEDNIEDDPDIHILGGDELGSIDATGNLGEVKVARGMVDGNDPDNNLEPGEVGLITSDDQMNKIEEGNFGNGADVREAILQNRHMLLNKSSKKDEEVLDELKMIEKSYQATLRNVVTDLQQSGYIDSDVDIGSIVAEVKGEDHFMAEGNNEDTIAGIDVSNLSEQEKKQLQFKLNMDMQNDTE